MYAESINQPSELHENDDISRFIDTCLCSLGWMWMQSIVTACDEVANY